MHSGRMTILAENPGPMFVTLLTNILEGYSSEPFWVPGEVKTIDAEVRLAPEPSSGYITILMVDDNERD